MEVQKVLEGVKNQVLTPAAKGAVEAVLESITKQVGRMGKRRGMSGLAIFAIGLAVGAGAGILLAPMPGKELRTKLMSLVPKRHAKLNGETDHAKSAAQPSKSDGVPLDGATRRQRQATEATAAT
jgi:gas vesicle protein